MLLQSTKYSSAKETPSSPSSTSEKAEDPNHHRQNKSKTPNSSCGSRTLAHRLTRRGFRDRRCRPIDLCTTTHARRITRTARQTHGPIAPGRIGRHAPDLRYVVDHSGGIPQTTIRGVVEELGRGKGGIINADSIDEVDAGFGATLEAVDGEVCKGGVGVFGVDELWEEIVSAIMGMEFRGRGQSGNRTYIVDLSLDISRDLGRVVR